jgi:hypothetical protein
MTGSARCTQGWFFCIAPKNKENRNDCMGESHTPMANGVIGKPRSKPSSTEILSIQQTTF